MESVSGRGRTKAWVRSVWRETCCKSTVSYERRGKVRVGAHLELIIHTEFLSPKASQTLLKKRRSKRRMSSVTFIFAESRTFWEPRCGKRTRASMRLALSCRWKAIGKQSSKPGCAVEQGSLSQKMHDVVHSRQLHVVVPRVC